MFQYSFPLRYMFQIHHNQRINCFLKEKPQMTKWQTSSNVCSANLTEHPQTWMCVASGRKRRCSFWTQGGQRRMSACFLQSSKGKIWFEFMCRARRQKARPSRLLYDNRSKLARLFMLLTNWPWQRSTRVISFCLPRRTHGAGGNTRDDRRNLHNAI